MSRPQPDKKKSRNSREQDRHRPFRNLSGMLEEAGLKLRPDPVAPDPPPEKPLPSDGVEDLFARAMEGVRPTEWQPKPLESEPAVLPPASDPQPAELQMMLDALHGIPTSPVLDHPEYIEGWVGVAGRRYLPNLRGGMYSLQGQLDLHGLSRGEARRSVEEFLVRMSSLRPCCVKIVHGRGINSPDDRAVLKLSLQQWLSTRRMSRHVLAYASAPFADGGVGAVYVLLRGPARR